ncbi:MULTISPECIES: adenylyl-sulfate kinase [unclassified Sporolactobacillus]|uniref:adenylyl-sulfate kinase n=1 Tax=unclassified Sporolactobacillus TaxID=2628533 RepID=UPI00236764D5|nr:adenylyl-sulfate kinase [Sporolactobacillus sp. CQH2019]MDD9148244.1 adenylyl-sulfate kinase [Sporolactobacillus sp. CQH2019]
MNPIVQHPATVKKADREKASGHKGAVVWLTGLSGSGKSTLANRVEAALFSRGIRTYLLDGDNIRSGLNSDLGFSDADRKENIRRISEVAKLFVDSNAVVLTAFISPFRKDRLAARKRFESDEFIEIYVACPLKVCESRDPKGLYQKARSGIISDFTGIDSPYEAPESPELVVDTDKQTLPESADQIVRFLEKRGIIGRVTDQA